VHCFLIQFQCRPVQIAADPGIQATLQMGLDNEQNKIPVIPRMEVLFVAIFKMAVYITMIWAVQIAILAVMGYFWPILGIFGNLLAP